MSLFHTVTESLKSHVILVDLPNTLVSRGVGASKTPSDTPTLGGVDCSKESVKLLVSHYLCLIFCLKTPSLPPVSYSVFNCSSLLVLHVIVNRVIVVTPRKLLDTLQMILTSSPIHFTPRLLRSFYPVQVKYHPFFKPEPSSP